MTIFVILHLAGIIKNSRNPFFISRDRNFSGLLLLLRLHLLLAHCKGQKVTMAMDADRVLASFRESHAWEVSEFSVDLYDDPNADSPKSIDLTQWMIATSRSDPKENVRIS
jgi:hypothetical protein